MKVREEYVSPEIVWIVLADEIVRTSAEGTNGNPGTGEGELPLQPFGGAW